MKKRQIKRNNINNFYSHANSKIKKIEQERRKFGRRNSPWFNPIDFWWIDEKKISQILAYLLNPDEDHEQGDRYLRHFIKKFGLDYFVYSRHDKINVKCGLSTHEGKKLDIVIHKNSFELAFAIINRADMSNNELQEELEHYSEFLWSKTGNDYSIIYISPQGKGVSPSILSREERRELERSKKFKYLTYEEHLIDCIAEFGLITESVRVKSFLEDFEKTMRKIYMGEKDIETKRAIMEVIDRNERNLEISFMVSNSLPEVKRKLKEEFNSQMESLKRELNLDAKQESDRVWLKPKKWERYYFSYAYKDGHILYGMTQDKGGANRREFSGVINHLNQRLNGGFQFSEWWPLYKYLYKDIDDSPDFWMAIKNGKAKKEIKKFIELMVKRYEKEEF